MTKKIHRIYLESRRLFGSPKITQKLLREGERVSQKTVSRIMKEHQLRSVTVKKYKATTNRIHSSIAYRTPAEMIKDYHRRQRSQVS